MAMVKPVFTIGPSADAVAIRMEVFVKEQHVVNEMDEFDPSSWSLVLYLDGVPMGTGRIYKIDPATYQVGRVAVLKPYRHQGVGTYIMKFLQRKAIELGANTLLLHAQVDKIGFYSSLGYVIDGDGEVFYDENIPHVHMKKTISKKNRYNRKR